VLNWAGFKAAVSYNFDDANSSQVANYGTLNGLGVHFTFYVIGNKLATSQAAWAQAAKDGHELGNHTQDHNNVTAQNVDQGQQTIEADFGVKVNTMAAPNGTTGYDTFAQTRYLLNRGVADGLMMPGNETAPSPCVQQ
jgi:peptidoglycan/xylan/chitin deacetylase (PgdA/CDA1 family)